MRKTTAIISSLLFSLLFGCASPVSFSVEPSLEPASIEKGAQAVESEYGELQEVKPLQEPFTPGQWYTITPDRADYNDEGEIIGFHESTIHDLYTFYAAHPDRIEIYCSNTTKQLSPVSNRSKTKGYDDLVYYSPWSKSADALCFELGQSYYSITVKIVLALDDPASQRFDRNFIPAITVYDYTLSYDADYLRREDISKLIPLKEGETTISVSWNGLSCEKKVLINGDKEKTFNLSCFYNGGRFGDVYLSNGSPYKGGDIISIEFARKMEVRLDWTGGPYGWSIFFNGRGLMYSSDETCLYKKADDDRTFLRLSFEMPCSDCELVFWDYDIYS